MDFIVATGIECSAPIIRGGIRRDQDTYLWPTADGRRSVILRV